MRGAGSFAVSAFLHGGVLGWVVFGPGLPAPEPARSIYDRVIRPNEKKIVWYNLREKLPEVAPADAHPDTRPPRARVRFNQTVVSGAKDNERPPQLIWTPEPAVAPAVLPPVPLPNVVAVAPASRLVRPFVAPPTQPRPDTGAPALPEAPRAASNAEAKTLPLFSGAPRPQPLPFTPPPEVRMQRQAALLLPDAPAVEFAMEVRGLPIAAPVPRPRPRAFTAPPGGRAPGMNGGLPAAPDVGPPPVAESLSNQASLAIVGLNPANTTVVPAAPGSREAGFSAGTVVRPEGGMGGSHSGAQVAVPGLLLRGGVKDDQPSLVVNFSPTSPENLMEASRMALGSAASAEARATRVSASPDPRMAGRLVYTVAIQMPNVTSYSGSWIVWFAVREAGAGSSTANIPGSAPTIRPPVPLRKVDPKYIRSAVSDRVEGKVLLRAVIRKDGQVESVVLLRGLDDRLDRSAEEALAKWAFEPATRDGSAVDVDAVFEIPFRLAPKPIR
jgi:TonB family protein